jgi:hypothetical protein
MQISKISREFASRLDRLRPRQKIRAIVMLDAGQRSAPTRNGARARGAAVAAVRDAADTALPDIDVILERHDGRRLSAHADALGCLPVEVTVDGIAALARSKHVKAIFEDQPISLMKN